MINKRKIHAHRNYFWNESECIGHRVFNGFRWNFGGTSDTGETWNTSDDRKFPQLRAQHRCRPINPRGEATRKL